jgi:hypothetical protein
VTQPDTLDLEPMVRTLKVRDKRKRLIPFEPNWAQKEILQQVKEDYEAGKPTRIICLKARQIGISTITEAIIFCKSVLFPSSVATIGSLDTDQAVYLFDMFKCFHEEWEFSDLYQTEKSSRRELVFEDIKSSIIVKTGENPKAFRGRTYTDAHISEVAFWTKPVEAMLAIEQGFPFVRGNFEMVESTANGIGNWFEEEWKKAEEGKSDYTPFFFPWWRHYEYLPCGGEGCQDGTCTECSEASKHLKPKDAEERELLKMGATKAHLVWRRWAIVNKCFNNLDLFHQEYPACVVGGTRVGTDSGLIRIADARDAKAGTLGRVVDTHQQAESPAFTLRTKLGYEVTGTWDHPIFTPAGALVPLAAMKPDMPVQLLSPRLSERVSEVRWHDGGVSSSIVITPEWGRFLGLFMADGSAYRSGSGKRSRDTVSLVFDAKDTDLIEASRALMGSLFGKAPSVRVTGAKKGCVETRVFSRTVVAALEQLGAVDKDGRKVCVPECIWRAEPEVVREFLAGYFEGDGFNGYKYPRVVVFSKQEQMLKDVQLLLLAFGITCHRKNRPTKNGSGYEYVERSLNLRGEEAIMFNERIGFLSERKRGRSTQVAPYAIGRPRIQVTMTDEVLEVVPAGTAVTYDFTIEGGEAFDANGIKTHNTPREAFLASGVNAFNLDDLDAVFAEEEGDVGRFVVSGGEVRFITDPDGPWTVFRHPAKEEVAGQKGGEYFIGADPCYGSFDGDFAAAQVISRRTKEQVAVFHGRIHPEPFADELALAGKYFNLAVIAPETEGGGIGTIARLRTIYPKLYQRRSFDVVPGQDRSERQLGWSTNWKTKAELITKGSEMVMRGKVTIHHRKTYTEMKNYSFYSGKGYNDKFGPADEERGRDDLVMSWCIAIACEDQESPLTNYEVAESPDGVIWARENEEEEEW